MSSARPAELACVPSAIPVVDRLRHFALARELFQVQAKERVELPDGYAIRFASDAFEAVARFVANERKCCPFLVFELTLDSMSGPLWLRMTGPEGTRAVLDAELNLLTPTKIDRNCGCAGSTTHTNRVVRWAAAGGILAALGVCAACCLLPFALLSVGIAGAWVGTLEMFSAYKWPLIGLAVALLGYGFYSAYIKPKRACAAGAAGEVCSSSRSVRVGLWIATVLTVAGIVFEQVEPLLRGP